ncbi:MAG: DnaJ domain-containing protein [Cyanobacteria bacterium]|nr:DnaJ domain-containing protein [Cyanobacteriota bacterium]
MDDYYTLLGIDRKAAHADLRRAWRKLALRWHPDRAGSGATASFQRIQAAYAVLSDPLSRAAYDRRQLVAPPALRGRAPGVKLSRLCGNINGLFACGIAVKTGGDIIELMLTEEEAAGGGMIELAMRVPVRCQACAGKGTAPCTKCGGRRVLDDLFAAWLAVPAGVQDGEFLPPSAYLPGMLTRVLFRVRIAS